MTAGAAEDRLAKALERVRSEDWSIRRSGLKTIAARLRSRDGFEVSEELVRALTALAEDPKWEIRREVALAAAGATNLGDAGVAILVSLSSDGNRWVRDAAGRGLRTKVHPDAEGGVSLTRVASQPYLAYVTKLIRELGPRSLTPQIINDLVFKAGDHFYRELAADTAHEVRTLLTPLYGYFDKLRVHLETQRAVDESTQTYFRTIENRLQQLLILTEQISVYATQDSEAFARCVLRDVVDDALDISLESARAEIDVHVELDAALQVDMRPSRFRQALVNLLKNAVEAMPTGGGLHIVGNEDRAGIVVVTIKDTGEGMSDGQIQSAFRRFRTTKRRRGGTGLGLPIADRIIYEEHGGQLSVTSRPGAGTVVEVRVPKRQPDGAAS